MIREVLRNIPDLPVGMQETVQGDRFGFVSLEHMDPYLTLRLLCENPTARGLNVTWEVGGIVDAGYLAETEVYQPVPQKYKYVIVCEGASDESFFRKSFEFLRPDVARFFEFLDPTDYPIGGAPLLSNFLRNCGTFEIPRMIIGLFDNDAEGVSSCNRANSSNLPPNILAMTIPYVKEFEAYPCRDGEHSLSENINGRAVTPETLLHVGNLPPVVKWKGHVGINRQGVVDINKNKFRRWIESLQSFEGLNTNVLLSVVDEIIDRAKLHDFDVNDFYYEQRYFG